MKTVTRKSPMHKSGLRTILFAFSAGILAASPVWAAYDIPNSPLLTNARIPANLLIQLDDSGSMQWDFMPGASNSGQVPATTPVAIQLQTYTRNTLYYNPNITYQPWLTSVAGVRLPVTPYTAVSDDDIQAGGATVNLNTSKALPAISFPTDSTNRIFHAPKDPAKITNLADASQYYRYVLHSDGTATQQVLSANVWVDNQIISEFTWLDRENKEFTRSVAEERQNFANWYSYHRTRTKVAKAGISEAFNDLGDSIRVGYDTIWGRNPFRIPVNNDDGLFRGANRDTFYTRLQSATANNGTPLRSALRRSGEYFRETGNDGPYGPLIDGEQLTCRQNFTILTTDGYWNSDNNFNEPNRDGTIGVDVTDVDGNTVNTYDPVSRPFMDNQINTLADVAMNYWKHDLRTDLANNVPKTSANLAFWQHMVTFGISIGLQGTLDPDTDLDRLKTGAINWPNAIADSATAIDDLFHAAVNGHGDFVVANDPQELTKQLQGALAAIIGRIGSASNVSANSVSVGNDTRIYQASYITGQWTGEIKAFPIENGVLKSQDGDEVWNASKGIPDWTTRKIFTYESGGAAFPTATQRAYLTPEIADYIKGDRSLEKLNNDNNNKAIYRDRINLMGDIISSSPSYSKDSDTIFIGANDGMVHAINGSTGAEIFTYVPGIINMSNLKTLSDDPYEHRYLVDGPVTVTSTLQTPGKNYLVGSLGRGGKGIYVLDVTKPATFDTSNVLWEADGSDDHMGLVTSRPIITKANTGDQVVIVSNGVNSNDKEPALFVYRLSDGVRLAKIAPVDVDGAGPVEITNNTSGNGLSAATGIDDNADGRVDFVYAGDMLGNLWKFDLSSNLSTKWEVANNGLPMFSAKDPNDSKILQPISGGVAIGFDSSNKPWIYFGTGRFLTSGDIASTNIQTWYGLRDNDEVIPGRGDLKQRKVEIEGTFAGKNVRAFEPSVAGDMDDKKGWYIDLINPPYDATKKEGERIVGTPLVRGTTVIVSTSIPSDNPCKNTGAGYINVVDAFSGSRGLDSPNADGYLNLNGINGFSDDKITDKNGKSYTIGSVDLGVNMPTDALVLAGDTNELIVVGGSLGGTASAPFKGTRIIGRISWHEMINN